MRRREFLSGLGAPAYGRARAGDLEQTDLFIAGRDGYNTYRIPALIVSAKGTLLAFVEGRKDNARDEGDIDLLVKRSTDGGRTWSDQRVVYEEGGSAKVTIGNPCPVLDGSTGTLWLPFCRDNNDVLITSSTDDGLSWSPPAAITSQVKKPDWTWYATGPGVGIQLRQRRFRGRLVIPCDHGAEREGQPVKFSHVFYSDDHGRTWRLGGSSEPHTNECQAVELSDGSLLLNIRNHLGREGGRPEMGGCRTIAQSRDGGATWSAPRLDRALIEPVCQASLIRFGPTAKDPVLFSNPADQSSRVRLTVRMSRDEGKSWPVAKVLHEGPSGYSCLARLPDGAVGCLYERGDKSFREKITFARFPLAWVEGGR